MLVECKESEKNVAMIENQHDWQQQYNNNTESYSLRARFLKNVPENADLPYVHSCVNQRWMLLMFFWKKTSQSPEAQL